MLPPMVAPLRISREANSGHTSSSSGTAPSSPASTSDRVSAAPTRIESSSARSSRSSGSRSIATAYAAREPRRLTSTPQSVEPATTVASGWSREQRQRLGQVGRPGEAPVGPVDPGGSGRRCRAGAAAAPAGRRPAAGPAPTPRRGSGGSRCSGRGCRSWRAGRSRWVRARGRRRRSGRCRWCGHSCDRACGRRGRTRRPCCTRTRACSSRTASRRARPSRAGPGAGRRGSPRPSAVTTSCPSSAAAGTRQALIAVHWVRVRRPSGRATRTEQAPHSPSAQPSFAPVRPRRRRKSSAVVLVGTPDSARGSPLTVIRGSVISLPRSRTARPSPRAWLGVVGGRWLSMPNSDAASTTLREPGHREEGRRRPGCRLTSL